MISLDFLFHSFSVRTGSQAGPEYHARRPRLQRWSFGVGSTVMGVPPVIHFRWGFSLTKTMQLLGYHLWTPPIYEPGCKRRNRRFHLERSAFLVCHGSWSFTFNSKKQLEAQSSASFIGSMTLPFPGALWHCFTMFYPNGGFHKWGPPTSMVYKGKPY